MSPDVIDFKSRRPVAEIEREQQEAVEATEVAIEQIRDENRAATVEMLQKVIKLVEKGSLTDMVILANHPESGLFFSDVAFFDSPDDLGKGLRFIGALEMLKVEFTEIASNTPMITSEGSILTQEEYNYEDEEHI